MGKVGHAPPQNLASNKFQERPSDASGMQENLLAPRTPLGELTAILPQPPSWWGVGLLPFSRTSPPLPRL